MIIYYKLGKDHNVIPIPDGPNAVLEWARDFESKDRIVKQETLPNGYWVSTVFLGIDHGFRGGKPLLFETMVFGKKVMSEFLKKKVREDCYQDRFTTWQEAVEGHQKAVKRFSRRKSIKQ